MAYKKPIPTGEPPWVDRIDVEYGLPNGGYWPITVRAAVMMTNLRASEVFPPFRDMIRWLEGVLDGEYPELFIDIEGADVRFYLFPCNDDIRLVVINDDENDEDDPDRIAVDVAVGRIALVDSFYRPLLDVWDSDDLALQWIHWRGFGPSKDELDSLPRDQWPVRVLLPPVRSAKIDAALEVAGRKKG